MTSSEPTAKTRTSSTNQFETSDACQLQYRDIGKGDPVVLLHGSFQSGAFFKKQYEDESLTADYRLIIPDLRGHGESSNLPYGYRISRLAKDTRELVAELGIDDATWVGWSMGCMVIWSYWDLFGAERINQLVLIDSPAWMLNHNDHDLGLVPPEEALNLVDQFRDQQEGLATELVDMMASPSLPDEDREWMIEENLKIPAERAADLAWDVFFIDWRDVIPRIDVPTLVVGAKESHLNWEAQTWIAEQLPNGELEVFDDQGHLMFYEAPRQFNELLSGFLEAGTESTGA